MSGIAEPFFEVAPATCTSNDDNGRQHRFCNTTGKHPSDPSHTISSSTKFPAYFTDDTDSLSGSLVSSLTSSSITINSDKETFLRNALRRAKLLQEYHSRREQEEVPLSPSHPLPKHWVPRSDESHATAAGHAYERGIIQIENARINARHAPRKVKAQFKHAKSDDIVDSILHGRPSLQHRTSINTTLRRISQEQDRCRERLRLLKAVSNGQTQTVSKFAPECFSDYIEDDDDDSSGYFSSDSVSYSTNSIKEFAANDVPVTNYAFVVVPAILSEKALHTKSEDAMTAKDSSPQTPPDANGTDLSTEEMSYLMPISLFEGEEVSSSVVQSDDHSSSAKSEEFQDVWTWFGDEDCSEMRKTKRSKAKGARICAIKSSKILCFRKNKRKRYAAMDDQLSLLSDV